MKLQFLGATRQVTGSRYCLHADGHKVMVDCGMYQERSYLDRNWAQSPIRPREIDALLLTHAHVDHCGLAPKLVREGFRGEIITTDASAELVELILRDSAKIQMEDAEYKRKRHKKEGRKGRHPVEPLFTTRHVDQTLKLLKPVPYDEIIRINDDISAVFHDAGHILGSAMVELRAGHDDQARRILFSGDIGQTDKPLVRDPTKVTEADYVVMESTYGDREHEDHGDVDTQLADIINSTVAAGGNVVMPTFAIERSQEVIYHLSLLMHEGRIPELPVFLDSPMAVDATDIFRRYRRHFDDETWQLIAAGGAPLRFPSLQMVRSVEQSKAINTQKGPAIIMSTSGMCTAGRIKFHLRKNITREECTILFVGYQAAGTLGRHIVNGAGSVRIHGRNLPVRASVRQIHGFSGHADRPALLRWLNHFEQPPREIFLTHGDEDSALSLSAEIEKMPGWKVSVPEYQQTIDLD